MAFTLSKYLILNNLENINTPFKYGEYKNNLTIIKAISRVPSLAFNVKVSVNTALISINNKLIYKRIAYLG